MADGVILLPDGKTPTVGAIRVAVGKMAAMENGAIPAAVGKTTMVGVTRVAAGKILAAGVIQLAASNSARYGPSGKLDLADR